MLDSLLPPLPGTYLLLLRADEPLDLQIGRLGCFHFSPGRYAYAGSALGPGGLAARVARHLRGDKKMRWHIDYLTAHMSCELVLALPSPARLECAWVHRLLDVAGVTRPIPGLGASDCAAGCGSHLLALPPGFPIEGHECIPLSDWPDITTVRPP